VREFTERSDENQPLLPKFKDSEDEQFVKELFRKTIINQDELRGLIDVHSSNWDIERIAFMDILIMQLAMSEFLYFPSIPTKVTLNEYIELSKYYSTDKSRNFINGILDNTLKELKLNNRIRKAGRGLIGESS
jgi:N utilization substance protein B